MGKRLIDKNLEQNSRITESRWTYQRKEKDII